MRQRKSSPSTTHAGAPPARLAPTSFDALAVAVSTGLIIGMVGSLVFFLIIAFYRGQYDSRLMYIFGLYTAATVLVARIAIESGRAYANAFSLPLAIATSLAIMRFVTISGPLGPLNWLINIALLAIAWFLADRITFDCTLISDRQQSLQQGLLQSLGLLRPDGISKDQRGARHGSQPPQHTSLANNQSPKQRKHNPGIWVLYFAVLAFPLFGLGQLAIPDAGQRGWAFTFLVSYLACSLSLLVLTSLVGMRRYLRQRGVAMPEEISLRWLTMGVGSVLLILGLCWLLPLPGRSYGLTSLLSQFQSPNDLTTSRWGWADEGSGNQANPNAARAQPDVANAEKANGKKANGEKANGEKTSPDAPAGAPPRTDGKGSPQASGQAGDNAPRQSPQSESKDATQSNSASQATKDKAPDSRPKDKAPDSRPKDKAPDSHPRDNDQNNRQPGDQADGQPPQQTERNTTDSNSGSSSTANHPLTNLLSQIGSLSELFKWLLVALLAAIVLIYAVTHPTEIAHVARTVWATNCVVGPEEERRCPFRRDNRQPVGASQAAAPFSLIRESLAAQLSGWTPPQVVEHSFAALEAWGAEHGLPRKEQQTAAEYARQLGATLPSVGSHAVTAANMLDQLMFADWQPRPEDLKPLAQLWSSLALNAEPSRLLIENRSPLKELSNSK